MAILKIIFSIIYCLYYLLFLRKFVQQSQPQLFKTILYGLEKIETSFKNCSNKQTSLQGKVYVFACRGLEAHGLEFKLALSLVFYSRERERESTHTVNNSNTKADPSPQQIEGKLTQSVPIY